MNPQQIQQVRNIAQEQIAPFQQQHSDLIAGMEKNINMLFKKIESISDNGENEKLKLYITKQEEENKRLKDILSLQKEEYAKNRNDISNCVNEHTQKIDKNINAKLLHIDDRLVALENNEKNFSIPVESLESVFDSYNHKKIINIESNINGLDNKIAKLKSKKINNENDKSVIQKYKDCLTNSLPELAAIEVKNKINSLSSKLESVDIQKIDEEINSSEQKKNELQVKLLKLRESII